MIPLDFLRNLTAEFRPDTCVIQRATTTTDGDGTTSTFATLATVSCRVSRVGQGASEGMGGTGGITAIGQRRIKLPPGQDVTTRDRIVHDGTTYEIADVPNISNEVETTAICKVVS